MKAIVIGVGNLGIRHIQSLLESPEKDEIYAVDPSLEALVNCREKIKTNLDKSLTKVHFVETLEALPSKAEVAIISTNSKVRCKVIFKLLERVKVKYLILEKVLFPCLSEYEKVQNLLFENNVKTWVNHARREYHFYQELKEALAGDLIIHVSVVGGDWGLGCNGLHFMDLFEYLTDSKIDKVYTEMLNDNFHQSKRSGYVEFSGTIGAISNSASLTMTSYNYKSPVSISIDTNMRKLTIYEGICSVIETKYSDNVAQVEVQDSIVEYQSKLTYRVVSKLISSGSCSLPSFDSASRLHYKFISALTSREFVQNSFKEGYVPIT